MPPLSCVFLDAAGTLFHLREPVGEMYARIASQHGITVLPAEVEKGFKMAWRSTPPLLHPEGAPPADDDAGWWRTLVAKTFQHATALAHGGGSPDRPALPEETLEPLFQELYAYFAQPEPWVLFEDTLPALEMLRESGSLKLVVLSNFDRRLFTILEGLGLRRYFDAVIVSSEVGASKPHPRIFARALAVAGVPATECLHIGDDPRCDLEGAQAAGMQGRILDRPHTTLLTIAKEIKESAKK